MIDPDMRSSSQRGEVTAGERFRFGENWQKFLATVDDQRIREAERSLQTMLERQTLDGLRFLDIGCGSGLFSLAARRLGAIVHSFDYDAQSVACAETLRTRYGFDERCWTIAEGSVLDLDYMSSLGQFDIVYSWGVLHHTGAMASALANAAQAVKPGGVLFIAIYNDQGLSSRFWKRVKQTYCHSPLGRFAVTTMFVPLFAIHAVVAGVVKYGSPLGLFTHYRSRRGMSIYHDWMDWLGGYPFEVAKPETLLRLYRDAGFRLINLVTTRRFGCNEFVFEKTA